jgi:signal transduction histidine kinase/CheY-like chemotaxis protein
MDSPKTAVALEPTLRVLIIEDDDVFAAGLQSLLHCNGCQVIIAKDGKAGIVDLHNPNPPFDFIFFHLNLPVLNGNEVIKILSQEGCSSRVTMVLDLVQIRGQPKIWEELQSNDIDIISKNDGTALKTSLLLILEELRNSESTSESRIQRQLPAITNSYTRRLAPKRMDNPSPPTQGYQEALHRILDHLKQQTRATTAVLLRLDPSRPSLVLEASAGNAIPLDRASPDLIYSPLNDILHKNQEVLVRVTPELLRFKRLLELLPFQGFMGIPLPIVESARYGLENHGFSKEQLKKARKTAYLIAGILQERRLIEALQPWQAQNLIGQISSSIVHEVNNKLSAIEFLVDGIQERLTELVYSPEKAQEATILYEIEHAVDKISNAQQQASELRSWYLGLTANDDPKEIDLGAIANEMIRALRSQAQQSNVILTLNSPKNLPTVRARPSQLQQIFLNIMLNAIQQMSAIQRTGNLAIEITHFPAASLPLKVRFIDDGPGIHTQLWEHIFDLGFTTKKGGAGLGLTIARQAAASLGGRIMVEKSHIFWGTIFLLELPSGV